MVLVHCRLQDDEARAALAHDVAHTVKHAAGIDAEVVLVPPRSIPVTTSGKISRAGARRRYLAGDYANTAGAA